MPVELYSWDGGFVAFLILGESEWPTAWILGVYDETIGPHGVKWMRIFVAAGVPDVLVHGFGAGGDTEDFALFDVPSAEGVIVSCWFADNQDSDAETKRFRVE